MNPPDVTLADLYRNSAWLRFLFGFGGRMLTVPGTCLLWSLVQAGFFALLCWNNGTLWNEHRPGELSLLEDTTALAYFFLLPFCFFLLYLNLRHFRRYLQRLDTVLEPSCPASAHADLVDEAMATMRGSHLRKTKAILIFLGIVTAIFNAFTNLWPDVFYSSPLKWDGIAFPLHYVPARIFVLIVWAWWIPTWLTAVLEQFSVMNQLHRGMEERDWLRISPYALDHFGGLRPLANGFAWTGYLVLAAGCFFLAPILRWVIWDRPLHPGNFVGMALYVVFAFVGIFLPTFMLQRALTRKRTAMLSFLNQAFDEINAQVGQLIKDKQPLRLGESSLSRGLETVDRLRSQWATLPTWPMGWSILLRFIATVVIPAIGFWAVQRHWSKITVPKWLVCV